MPALNPHEEALIRAFITHDRRIQFLRRAGDPSSRINVVNELAHFQDLDSRFAHRIPPRDQHLEAIHHLLIAKGAPAMCHVFGESDLDGRDVELREALEDVVRESRGCFISCIPGKLAYFEGEEKNERYILERQCVR